MNLNQEVKNLLELQFIEAKRRNPKFSLRAFAKKAGLSSGAVSEILNGKRKISLELAEKIAESLMISPAERPWNLRLQNKYDQLDMKSFEVIKSWEHLAILSLIKTDQFQAEPKWIARRLGLSVVEVNVAIQRLIDVGLVKNEKGALKRVMQRIQTTDGIANLALKMAHAEELKLAENSLQNDPVERRNFSSLTFAINPAKLKQARELIKKFEDQMSELLESKPQKEVYKLCVQLFPITKLEN